jgi:hypothetical protein
MIPSATTNIDKIEATRLHRLVVGAPVHVVAGETHQAPVGAVAPQAAAMSRKELVLPDA